MRFSKWNNPSKKHRRSRTASKAIGISYDGIYTDEGFYTEEYEKKLLAEYAEELKAKKDEQKGEQK